MSKWENRFSTHTVHETVKTLADALEGVEPEDTEQAASVERLRAVTEHLRSLLEHPDPQLVTPSTLDLIHAGASGMLTQVTAYASDNDPAHFESANTSADQALDGARGLLVVVSDKQIEALRKSAKSFRQTLGRLTKAMEQDATGAKSTYAAALEEIKTAKEDFETKRNAVQAKLDQLAAEIETQRQTLEATKSQFESTFTTSEQNREKALQDALTEQQDAFDEAMRNQTETANKAVSDVKNASAGLVKQLEGMKAQAQKLVGVIGSTGMSGGFQKYADQQGTAANWWAVGVIAPLLAIVGVAIWLIVETHGEGDVQLRSSLLKIFVSVPLAAIAGYSAQQTSRHRHNERLARKMELELASIDPFLAPLPEPDQHALKKEAAQRLFGQPDSEEIRIDKVGANQLIDLLRDAMKILGSK